MALTSQDVDDYLRDGVLVVPNVLSEEEVAVAREGMQDTLGIDQDDLLETGHLLGSWSSTNGAGGVVDVFYPPWKMKVATHPKLFGMTCQLWQEVYSAEKKNGKDGECHFHHGYGAFVPSRGFAYVDRIGYRLPSTISEEIGRRREEWYNTNANGKSVMNGPPKTSKKKGRRPLPLQRSLTPHLDCCPQTFYETTGKSKWRPIQCLVSLSDTLLPNHGGFEACKGFHRQFDAWVASFSPENHVTQQSTTATPPAPCIGEYAHIRPREDRPILEGVQHVPVPAGAAVFWDLRIPHANAYRHEGTEPRQVVYCSFLPDVPVNRRYVQRQLQLWKCGVPPSDQWIHASKDADPHHDGEKEAAGHQEEFENQIRQLSPLGRKLLGIDPWEEEEE